MADDELHILIEHLESEIERLGEIAEGCRKWVLLSKMAMGAGGACLLALVAGLIRFDAATLLIAISAMLGGFVLAGSNASTLEKARAAIKAAETLRAESIDRADLPAVESLPLPRQIR